MLLTPCTRTLLRTTGKFVCKTQLFSNRSSPIYDTKRSAQFLRQMIKNENEKHVNTVDGQAHKTLSEEEILNEKKQSDKKSNVI